MRIKLKRSSVLEGGAAKEPTAGQLEYGELAVNYNKEDPTIFLKDSNDNIIRIAGAGAGGANEVIVSATAPSTTDLVEGQLWWNSDSTSGKLFVLYDDPSGGGGADAGGLNWVETSPTPEIPTIFPDLNDGNNQPGTLDDRYLSTEADAGNQTVASAGTTKFNGLVEAGEGVKVTGGTIDLSSANGEIAYGADPRDPTYGDTLQIKGNNTGHWLQFYKGGLQVVGKNSRTGLAVGGLFAETYYQIDNTACQTFVERCDYTDASGDVQKVGFLAYPMGLSFQTTDTNTYSGFRSFVSKDTTSGKNLAYNFYASGGAPNFFQGDTYIGGTTTRNTRELWESLLTEEEKEQLSAGTLVIPANVSTPGDGSFVRQWWYDQQLAEDQALIDSGELAYPERYQPENFVDTFKLVDDTNINLMSTGEAHFAGNVGIGRTDPEALLDVHKKLSEADLEPTSGLVARFRYGPSSIPGRGIELYGPGNSSLGADDAHAIIKTFGTNYPLAIEVGTTPVEAMRFTSAGNVGIGTTDPKAKLDVDSDALINGLTVGEGGGSVANNTAVGQNALKDNTTGTDNVALGRNALPSNTEGSDNTALGRNALFTNTVGSYNTAVGFNALYYNTEGEYNTALGRNALQSNNTGTDNTAVGNSAMGNNIEGSNNTAVGRFALIDNESGSDNTAIGRSALSNITEGSGNIGIGGYTSAGNFAPVQTLTGAENDRILMGSSSVTDAYVKVAWTVTSDARDKTSFASVPYGLDFVKQLQPTAYQFKAGSRNARDPETNELIAVTAAGELPSGPVRYGFKAQDILALEGDNPVIIDNEDPDHLKYRGEALVPVLVNAIQEQQVLIDDLTTRLEALEGA